MADKKKRVVAAEININMTPMIDCTFQLIIFFILTSGIASAALAKLEVPKPHKSVAEPSERMQVRRVIVNVVPYYDADYRGVQNPANIGVAGGYVINNVKVEVGDLARLVRILKDRAAEAKEAGVSDEDFYVELRVDKSVNYMYVVPLMKAAADAGIAKMNIAALVEK